MQSIITNLTGTQPEISIKKLSPGLYRVMIYRGSELFAGGNFIKE
jgi:hypothetical protein